MRRRFPLEPLRVLAMALIVGALAHIVAVLILSAARGTDAGSRIAALDPNAMLTTFVPPAGSERFAPYRDPALAEAFCRFDLRRGAVQVSLPVTPLDFAALSVYAADGSVAYGLTNGAAVGGAITLSLSMPGQANGSEEQQGSVPRVVLNRPDGFVAAMALVEMPGLRASAEATVRGLACRPAKM